MKAHGDFRKEKITLGRSRDNDIVLNSRIVSLHHGYFFIDDNGIQGCISEEDYDTFFNIVKECCINSKEAENIINKLSSKYLHDKEYGDFEDGLMQRQNNNLLLNNQ